MSNKFITVKDKQYSPESSQMRGGGQFGYVKGFVGAVRLDDEGTMQVEYDGLESSYNALKKCLEDSNFEIVAA